MDASEGGKKCKGEREGNEGGKTEGKIKGNEAWK